MSTYSWRVGIGVFNLASSWRNEPSQIPATEAPGYNDTAILNGPGQILTQGTAGPAYIDQLTAQATPGAAAWTLALPLTARQITTSTGLVMSAGAAITLLGRPSTTAGTLPTAALLNGATTIDNATLDAAGALLVGVASTVAGAPPVVAPSLLITNGARVSAIAATIGTGTSAALGLYGPSSLQIRATTDGPSTGTLRIGSGQGGNGQISIAAGAALTLDRDLILSAGTATFSSGGTAQVSGLTTLSGSTTLTGAGTTLASTGRLTIGQPDTTLPTATLAVAAGALLSTYADIQLTGRSTLNIQAGGTLRSNAALQSNPVLRLADAAAATLSVTGSAALLDLGPNSLQVGTSSILSLRSGGQATIGNLLSAGTAQLDGASTRLTLGTLALSGSLALTASAAVNAAGPVNAASGSTLTLSGAGTTLTTNTLTSSGTTSLSDGATLTATPLDRSTPALSLAATPGSSTISVSAATLDARGTVSLGRAGSANLLLDRAAIFLGGIANQNDVILGDGSTQNPGGSGTVSLQAGSTLRSRANLIVGQSANGRLTLDAASIASADTLIQIGTGSAGLGTVLVQGGSTLRSTGPHIPGISSIQLGIDPGTTGNLTITGPNSTLDTGGDGLAIGLRGAGTLLIDQGATATAGTGADGLTLAPTIGSSGTVTVRASQLTVAGTASLGGTAVTSGGIASLTLQASAVARLGSLTVWSGAALRPDASSQVVIGNATAQTGIGTLIGVGATLTLQNGLIDRSIANAGTILSYGGTISGTLSGNGQLILAGGTTSLAGFSGRATFTAPNETLRLSSLTGFSTIDTIAPGDTIELPGQSATLTNNVVSIGTARLQLTPQPGTTIRLESLPSGTRITVQDPLFDTAYYLATNPDVKASGADPYLHYLNAGWKEGRNPSALFDTKYYLGTNPDVAAAGVNPLLQFESSGWREGRRPDPVFDTRYYLATNPDVAEIGLNPLVHYTQSGWKEGRNPSAQFSLANYRAAYQDVAAANLDPLSHYLGFGRAEGRIAFTPGPPPGPGFDSAYYYAQNSDVKSAGIDAFTHWKTAGLAEGRNPGAWFDARFYLTQNPDVKAAGFDPLAHFISSGALEGRDPSLIFSATKYTAANPDVRAAGLNSLVHYQNAGRLEGRMTFLSGPTAPADPLVQTAFYDRQLGATLIPTGTAAAQQATASYNTTGWQRGLDPDQFFDTKYYLAQNPDVARAGLNPLLHYENAGWREGRNPGPLFSTAKYLATYADVRAAGLNPLAHYLSNGQAEGRTAFSV